MSYKAEIIEKKDAVIQLEASKLSIKDLFSDILNETKGFKYQTTIMELSFPCKKRILTRLT